MKQNLLIEIQKHFPNMKEVAIPTDCPYTIDYAKKKCFQGPEGRIFFQEYDAKDALFNLMEFDLKVDIILPIEVIFADLFWLYLLAGSISILDENGNPFPGDWLHDLEEREYVVLFSSPRKYKVVLNTEYHLLHYFSPARKWLMRHSKIDGKEFQEITQYLYGNQNTYYCSKILKFDPIIDGALLVLLGLKKVKGLTMDTNVYVPMVELITISRNDIDVKEEEEIQKLASRRANQILLEVHKYIEKQFEDGKGILSVMQIANHFGIKEGYLRNIHNEKYKFSLQSFITDFRLYEAQIRVINTLEELDTIGYSLDFNTLKNFVKQYRIKFKIHPIDDRARGWTEETKKNNTRLKNKL